MERSLVKKVLDVYCRKNRCQCFNLAGAKQNDVLSKVKVVDGPDFQKFSCRQNCKQTVMLS